MRTIKRVTYWDSYTEATVYLISRLADFPEARIVGYQKGWAIQREKSGPYWNAMLQEWQ